MKLKKSIFKCAKIIFVCLIGLMPMVALAHETDLDRADRDGGLRIGWVSENKTHELADEPKLLKETLDLGWEQLRTTWQDELNRLSDPSIEGERLQLTSKLASTEQTDLQVMSVENGAAIKYVVYHNKLDLTLRTDLSWAKELSYLVAYDIEIGGTVQTTSDGEQLRFRDGAIRFQNVQIEGQNFVSALSLPLVEFLIEQLIESAEEISKSLLPSVDDLMDVWTDILDENDWLPQEKFYTSIGVEAETGTLQVCFKAHISQQCTFEN